MHKAPILVFVFGQDFLSVINNFDDTFVACCSCILRVPSCRMSMAGPLGRGAGDLGAPANNAENINGEPSWGAMWEIRQRTPLMIKTSMVGPLGGDAEDLAAPTINTKKCRWRPHWEAVPEIREHPPSTLKNVNGGPPGGADGDLGVSTINVKNFDGGPPGRC
jgi:hypothetical protein